MYPAWWGVHSPLRHPASGAGRLEWCPTPIEAALWQLESMQVSECISTSEDQAWLAGV